MNRVKKIKGIIAVATAVFMLLSFVTPDMGMFGELRVKAAVATYSVDSSDSMMNLDNVFQSDNTTNNYSQFTLTCTNTMSDNYHCNSKFLECLASLSNVASKANLCNNILEGRNLTNRTDYGDDELEANRGVLINKLMRLS